MVQKQVLVVLVCTNDSKKKVMQNMSTSFLCKLIFINKTLLIFMTDKNALPVAAS